MKKIFPDKTFYTNNRGTIHRIGLVAALYDVKSYYNDIYYFNGKCHRINGEPYRKAKEYFLYDIRFKLNISKLVM